MQTDYKKYIWLTGSLALLSISFAAIGQGLNDFSLAKHPNGQVASITVSGEGEVTAIPDIATVTFTVREVSKTVPEAQKLAEAKVAQAIKDLSTLGVDKKDTKTLSYTINPKYEQQGIVTCTVYGCPPTKTVVTGYEVSQSMQVKVRKINQAGNVIGILGKVNITEVAGLDFTVEDMDKAKAEAKSLAIAKAQEKAKATSRSLGVSLGSILSFNEDNGGAYPVMYARADVMSMKSVAGAAEQVTLPQGESVIKSTVTITYTLK